MLKERIVSAALALTMLLSTASFAFADTTQANTTTTPVATEQAELTASQVKALKPKATAKSYSYSKIKVSWPKIEGLDGYQVYRASSKTGKYSKVYTTTKNSYINTGRTTGKTYYYKVRGYKVISGKTYFTKFSDITATYARPAAPKNLEAEVGAASHSDIFVLHWNKSTGASGYQLQIRVSDKAPWRSYYKWKKDTIYEYQKSYPVSWSDKTKLWGDKFLTYIPINKAAWQVDTNTEPKFQFRVRAYRTVSGKKVFGNWSTPYIARPLFDGEELMNQMMAYAKKLYPKAEFFNVTYDKKKQETVIHDQPVKMTPEKYTSWSGLWGHYLVNPYSTEDVRLLKHSIKWYLDDYFDDDQGGCLYVRKLSNQNYQVWWVIG